MSVKKKIILTVIAGVVVLVGVFARYFAVAGGRYRQLYFQDGASNMELTQNRLRSIVGMMQRNCNDLAVQTAVVLELSQSGTDATGKKRVQEQLRQNLLGFSLPVGCGVILKPGVIGEEGYWSASIRRSAAGMREMEWRSSATGALPESASAWAQQMQKALQEEGRCQEQWFISDGALVCALPIAGKDGAIIGAVAVGMPLERLNSELLAGMPVQDGVVAVIDHQRGRYLAGAGTLPADRKGADEGTPQQWWERIRDKTVDSGIVPVPIGDKEYLLLAGRKEGHWLQVVAVVPKQQFVGAMGDVALAVVLIMAAITALVTWGMTWLLRVIITDPMQRLLEPLPRLGQGDLTVHFPEQGWDEFAVLGRAFNRMTGDLAGYIRKVELETGARERMNRELSIASQIQDDLLPEALPYGNVSDRLEIHGTVKAAREVGGDYFDFFAVNDRKLFFVVADVSGKGIPAALFMMCARTIMRNNAIAGMSPQQILQCTNRSLCESNQSSMFVTALVGILDLATGQVTLANAGHNLPYFIRDGKATRQILPAGLVLGALSQAVFLERQFMLSPGDCLYLYTDGVTEAQDSQGQLLGDDGLQQALERAGKCGAREVMGQVDNAIANFVGTALQSDDITQLCLQWKGGAEK